MPAIPIGTIKTSKHDNRRAGGVVRVTGSLTIRWTDYLKPTDGSNQLIELSVQVESAVAADANNGANVTARDNGDGTLTISCWASTGPATTTLVASAVAVPVRVAFGI